MINVISAFYVERIEPLIFRFRRSERLRSFGLDGIESLPSAALTFEDECRAARLCNRLVRLYTQYYARYAHSSPVDSLLRPMGGIAAIIPLSDFADCDAYHSAIRKRSKNFAQSAKKAVRAQYFVEIFNRANRAPDILAIRKSMKFRAFGPVLDAFFLTLDRLGGAPLKLRPIRAVECNRHWEVCLGVFINKPGHRLGEIAVDSEMVAYVRLHRAGNVVRFADFIGHRDHLQHGVMMLLQLETMRWLMRENAPEVSGIEYLTYGTIEQGTEGLLFWKRKALFRPMLLE
jgi:hypothetical protein